MSDPVYGDFVVAMVLTVLFGLITAEVLIALAVVAIQIHYILEDPKAVKRHRRVIEVVATEDMELENHGQLDDGGQSPDPGQFGDPGQSKESGLVDSVV